MRKTNFAALDKGSALPEYAVAVFILVVTLSGALIAMNKAIDKRAESSMGIVSTDDRAVIAPCSADPADSGFAASGGECL